MNAPHGHRLVDRFVPASRRDELVGNATDARIALDNELLFDLVNVATGRYSPLTGFMSRNDFVKVLSDMTLEAGEIWSLPVVLDVETEIADRLDPGDTVPLAGPEGRTVGVIDIDGTYRYEDDRVCLDLFGTTEREHPGVELIYSKAPRLVGGDVRVFDDVDLGYGRYGLTPTETRVLFEHQGWDTVAGFQTRNVPHRAHEYLQKSTLEHVDGIFVQPKMGLKKEGDYTDDTILSGYESLMTDYYPDGSAAIGIFPSRMWYGGPREAVFDAIVRKNHGCTHFIVGRDHAGVGDYYGDFAAQELFERLPEMGIDPMFYHYSFFCEACDGMASEKTCPHERGARVEPSGTELRRLLESGERPSPKLMRPEVVETVLNVDDLFIGR